jgi:hypothetical protein
MLRYLKAGTSPLQIFLHEVHSLDDWELHAATVQLTDPPLCRQDGHQGHFQHDVRGNPDDFGTPGEGEGDVGGASEPAADLAPLDTDQKLSNEPNADFGEPDTTPVATSPAKAGEEASSGEPQEAAIDDELGAN